jgi:glutamine synthetase
MQREPIVFVGTSDLSGHFRGKSFPAADLPARLGRGVGLAPTNIFLSAFGTIPVTSFGTLGEVALIPDPSTRVFLPWEEGASEHFYIGDLRTLAGIAWDFCPRHVLRRAIERLQAETGLRMLATFEQEFIYSGVPATPRQPYQLEALRRQGIFGEALLAALRQVGVIPDSFLSEYGAQQFEVTVAPALGIRAADDAVITREVARAIATRLGQRVSFTPMPQPDGTGSGTHIHFSFLDPDDQPVLYAEDQPWQLAPLGRHFIAGVQYHLPALCAVTAPSVPSYYRLRPDRWAPVRADVGNLDRGAALRICPVTAREEVQRARQYNVEFRVADAAASPYLALAMLLFAGLDGLQYKREIETAKAPALPGSLGEALTLLEANTAAAEWLGADLLKAYLLFKRAEIRELANLDEHEICRRYADAY